MISLLLIMIAMITACTSVPECDYGIKYPDNYYKGDNALYPQTRPCRKDNDANA